MFTQAIVKTPCQNLTRGITTANLGSPDYDLAIQQHRDYIDALQQCGLNVTILDADESYPDSTFIEDTALVTSRGAILTNPGALSRRGETAAVAEALSNFFTALHTIDAPATLDAGDVMMTDDHFYIGLSSRTNQQGAEQLIDILDGQGLGGSMVTVADGLHLKSSLSYLENNRMLSVRSFLSEPQFSSFELIEVSASETYAANAVWVNDAVLVASGHPNVSRAVRQRGLQVIELDMSEFQKVDGGLSCLSLRF